jgi:hypothetical protein
MTPNSPPTSNTPHTAMTDLLVVAVLFAAVAAVCVLDDRIRRR